MKKFISIIYLILFINFTTSLLDLSENSSCPLHINSQDGICLQASKCEAFKTDRSKLRICSFNGRIPIVCCPQQQQQSFSKIKDIGSKRISVIKCEEYVKKKPFVRPFNSGTTRNPDVSFIVGGIEATFTKDLSEFPHMSAIGIRQLNNNIEWMCGGSLISENFVLSAAHCALFGRKRPDVIKIGAHNLTGIQGGLATQEFGIKNIIVHPQYKNYLKYHDLALFELSSLARLDGVVLPACLYQKNSDPQVVEVMGYGQTSFGGQRSNILLKSSLTIVNNDQCNQAYEDDSSELPQGIINSQVCAWDPEGNRDTCQGDSGGPLQIDQYMQFQKYFAIIGVTSFGKFCAAGVPGVYVRVFSYLDWIESIVWN